MTASYHELQPVYELYQELTSERFNGYGAEPHPSDVVHAIEFALWSKRLHLEFQEPFGPLQEPEWEPPRLKPKGPPAQTPSEIWGRRTETFIGIRLKDQNGDPISKSRIRVKLPDGSTREGATNEDGELEITGFTQDGNAEITFLDDAKPGKAEAPEWPEEKEFKTTVVDEMGKPVPHVWLWFRHGSAYNLVRTDDFYGAWSPVSRASASLKPKRTRRGTTRCLLTSALPIGNSSKKTATSDRSRALSSLATT
jgi:hypothetical protein